MVVETQKLNRKQSVFKSALNTNYAALLLNYNYAAFYYNYNYAALLLKAANYQLGRFTIC